VFKTTDGGSNWAPIDSGLTINTHVYAIAMDPSDTSVLYLGTSEGVYKSLNGGSKWKQATTGIPQFTDVTGIAIDPSATSVIYAATTGGVYKTTAGGGSWSLASDGLPSGGVVPVSSLAIDPTNPQTLWAGTRFHGVYKTTTGGTGVGAWSAENRGLRSGYINVLLLSPENSTLHAGTNGGAEFDLLGP
jgi:photosystem II stability/assembly factor-like uncharacterized protein